MLNSITAILDAGGAAGGGASYESIATATGTGSSNIITFTSIPQTYKQLQLRITTNDAGSGQGVRVQINNDTAYVNYTRHILKGDGSTVTALGTAAGTYNYYFTGIAAGVGTNLMSVGIIDFHDYQSTTKNKTVRGFYGYDDNSTNGSVVLSSCLWTSTDAISRLDVFLGSANFTTSSTFSLYGIKGA